MSCSVLLQVVRNCGASGCDAFGEWSVCYSLQEGPACSIACMRYFWGCGHRQRRRSPFVEAQPGVRTIVGMRAHRNSSGMDQSRGSIWVRATTRASARGAAPTQRGEQQRNPEP
eukprot:scaffold17794_cov57-Phaeocystis_antarctica.AAC.2